jgi:hypothetical protein
MVYSLARMSEVHCPGQVNRFYPRHVNVIHAYISARVNGMWSWTFNEDTYSFGQVKGM